jgi:dephospho-CoA kinase
MTLIIGLTGGIGSGKSTVAQFFKQRGVEIIDADEVAREMVNPGRLAYQKIIAHFGKDILKDNQMDREKLRNLIFTYPRERRWLESLLHPLIYTEILKRAQNTTALYTIVVIPLLFETSDTISYDFLHRILTIDLPKKLQLRRTLARDKNTAELIRKILKTQISRKERLKKADDIIVNDSSKEELEKRVEKLHQFYLSLKTS